MTSRMPQIIVADDDKSVRTVIVHALSRQGYQVGAATTIAGLWDMTVAGKGEVLITDVGFPDGDALELLPRLLERRPDLTIIVMSARTNLLTAIKTQQRGVFDYLPKPFELKQLMDTVARAAAGDKAQNRTDNAPLSLPDKLPLALTGKSPALQTSFKMLTRLSGQSLPVLIQAEAGIGKQEIARALYEISPASTGGFFAVNLLQTDEGQHVDALFGSSGALARSVSGVVFINHIERLSGPAQALLAQYIQEPSSSPASPYNALPTARIVAGTSVALKTFVDQGLFRDDLYFEFSAAAVDIPPLRARAEDIAQIAQLLAVRYNEQYAMDKIIDDSAIERLKAYHWPANIREMEMVIKRLFVTVPPSRITAAHVEGEIVRLAGREDSRHQQETDRTISDLLDSHISRYFEAVGNDDPGPGLHGRILAEMERPLITATLRHTAGNQIKAAHILGLNRNTLRKKIRELKISPRRADYR